MLWWAVVAVVSYGALAAALEQADDQRRTDAAIKAVDTFLDCAFYAGEGETCEREGEDALAFRGDR